MKVAILTIATGKYIDFLETWVGTVREKFLPGASKKMFIFTDAPLRSEPDLAFIPTAQLPWPLTSLFKFRYFKSIEKDLQAYDYIVHIDMDMYVANTIEEHELFDIATPYFGTLHPYWTGNTAAFYEKNPLSQAYISPRLPVPKVYWQGCFWGGRGSEVLALLTTCSTWIEMDLNRHIIARWYDESHLNKFFRAQPTLVRTLSPAYAYPQFWSGPYEKKIVHIEKDDAKYQSYLVAFPAAPSWKSRVRRLLQIAESRMKRKNG